MSDLKRLGSNKIIWVMILPLLIISCMSSISALDFDNIVKKKVIDTIKDNSTILTDYEKKLEVIKSKYPPIEIVNSFGLGDKILDGQIEEHTDFCIDDCHSKVKMCQYEEGKLIDNIKFYDITDGKNTETQLQDVVLKVDDKEIDLEKVYPIGCYYLDIYAKKPKEKAIDWIIESKGKQITDWAIWWNSATYNFQSSNSTDGTGGTLELGVLIYVNKSMNITRVGLRNPALETTLKIKNSANTTLYSTSSITSDYFNVQYTLDNNTWYRLEVVGTAGGYNIVSGYGRTLPIQANQDFIIKNLSIGGVNSTNYNLYTLSYINYSANNLNVTLVNPINNAYVLKNSQINLKCNITENSYKNRTVNLYHNYSNTWHLNQTKYSNFQNETNFYINTSNNDGFGSWNCQYCQDGFCSFSETAYTFYVRDYQLNSLTYNTTTAESRNEFFDLNMSYNTAYYSYISANIVYNGSRYTTTKQESDNNVVFSKNIIIPSISQTTNFNFYWEVALTNSSGTYYVNTSQYTQTAFILQPINISTTCTNKAYYFDFKDEETLTSLRLNVNYNFKYGLSGADENISGSLSNINNFSICINSTTANTWYIQGEIQYYNDTYVNRRYYLFDNRSATNNTNNITLYSLLESRQTSFQITAQETNLILEKNKYLVTMRWYPELNNYYIVDMGLTDNSGQTIIHTRTEDVDYRLGLYEKNGSLIYLANPIRMACLTSPCTYTLKISPSTQDYTSFLGIEYTLNFNETSKIWTLIFNDPSQRSSKMNLTVYKDTGVSSLLVCSTSTTSYTGVLTCDTSSYPTGTFRAVVYREASPPIELVQKIVQITTSGLKSEYGLFFSLLIAIPIIFVFILISPFALIIGGVVALIPALYFGSINVAIIGGIAIMGAIIAHFINRIP